MPTRAPFPLPAVAPPDPLAALLARLETLEAAHHAATAENRRLALHIQALEQHLRARKAAAAPPPEPGVLSLFGEPEALPPTSAAPSSR